MLYQALNYFLKNFRLHLRSFVQKQRLILERSASKQHFLTQIGTTFRNSKWFDYVKKNISTNQMKTFKKFIKICVIITSLVFLYTLIYSITTYFNVFNTNYNNIYASLLSTITTYVIYVKNIIKNLTNYIKTLFTANVDMPLTGINPQHTESWKVETKRDEAGAVLDSLTNATYKNLEVLDLLKQAASVSEGIQQLNDHKQINNLKMLLRDDLNWLDSTESNENDLDVLILKMWTNSKEDKITNPYKFDLARANQILAANPDWTLSKICTELKLPQDILEVMQANENTRVRKSTTTHAKTIFNQLFDTLNNTTKLGRWLAKNNFLHNQSLSNLNSVTNTKKLFTLYGETFDSAKTNMWIYNNINSKITSDSENLKTFVNTLANTYGDYLNLEKQELDKNTLNNNTHWVNTRGAEITNFNEESFLWFLKRMYLYNTNDSLSIKNTLVGNMDNLSDADVNDLELLNSKLLTQFITLKDTTALKFTNSLTTDILYNNSSNTSLDYTTLTLAYELTANRTNHNSVYPFYSLNSFSLPLSTKIGATNYDSDIITDIEDLKLEFRKQPTATIAMVDLLNKEYTKDLYRLILLLERLNNK